MSHPFRHQISAAPVSPTRGKPAFEALSCRADPRDRKGIAQIQELEHVGMEKVEQVFQAMLQLRQRF
jgi:hypothetical protein